MVSWQVAPTAEAPPSVPPSTASVPGFMVPRLADVRPTASLTFKTQRSLPFGQVLKLVGEARVMGEWDCEKAPGGWLAGLHGGAPAYSGGHPLPSRPAGP